MTSPAILERVADYRSATRRVVRAPASVNRRCEGILKIVALLETESDDTVREWCRRAVWEESRAFLGAGDPEPAGGVGDPWARAQGDLRAKGRDVCPTCRGHIATEQELRRLSISWQRWTDEVAAREGAVE